MTNVAMLIFALIMVESSGNDGAVNASGECWGPLQIKEIYVQDVNRIAGTSYTHEDAFDRAKSMDMFRIYMEHYATEELLGRPPTWEDIARIHAGGPQGWRDPERAPYWAKVQSVLQEMPADDMPAEKQFVSMLASQ